MKNRYAFAPMAWVTMGIPKPIAELKFCQTRRWAFDYAWPEHHLALEIDGGVWSNGRHTRGSGRKKDMEKQTAAAALGWRILYFTPQEILKLSTIETIKQAISWACTDQQHQPPK